MQPGETIESNCKHLPGENIIDPWHSWDHEWCWCESELMMTPNLKWSPNQILFISLLNCCVSPSSLFLPTQSATFIGQKFPKHMEINLHLNVFIFDLRLHRSPERLRHYSILCSGIFVNFGPKSFFHRARRVISNNKYIHIRHSYRGITLHMFSVSSISEEMPLSNGTITEAQKVHRNYGLAVSRLAANIPFNSEVCVILRANYAVQLEQPRSVVMAE